MTEQSAPHSRWAAFKNTAFMRFWIVRTLAGFAVQMQTVAVGWQVYAITGNPLDLGIVGLLEFLPALLLMLVTGAVADRFRRRTIMAITLGLEALCIVALLAFTIAGSERIWIVFLIIFGFGIARAFFNPAQQALFPNLVEPAILGNAIALNSAGWQIATICGPVVGGLLYDVRPELAYAGTLAFLLAGAAIIMTLPRQGKAHAPEPATWETIIAGIRFIWREKIVLGAISLDLFAVLLGGATALLPVYAQDILHVDATGLGMLRAAQAVGAIIVSLYLVTRSIRNHAGLYMFGFVALFGIFTIVFGVSTLLWLSLLALAIMGGADMVSVYIRETLIQLWTPDYVRGRVNAVNWVFIGASNELGAFRAGVSAWLLGAVPAVVLGGVGTIVVAALWAYGFPQLRRAQHLDAPT